MLGDQGFLRNLRGVTSVAFLTFWHWFD